MTRWESEVLWSDKLGNVRNIVRREALIGFGARHCDNRVGVPKIVGTACWDKPTSVGLASDKVTL